MKSCMLVQLSGPGQGLNVNQASQNPFPKNLELGENYTLTHGWTYTGNLRAVIIFYLPNGLSSKENQFAEKDQSVAKREPKSRHKETTPQVLG